VVVRNRIPSAALRVGRGEALLSCSINTQHFGDPYYFNSDVDHPRFVRVRQIQ